MTGKLEHETPDLTPDNVGPAEGQENHFAKDTNVPGDWPHTIDVTIVPLADEPSDPENAFLHAQPSQPPHASNDLNLAGLPSNDVEEVAVIFVDEQIAPAGRVRSTRKKPAMDKVDAYEIVIETRDHSGALPNMFTVGGWIINNGDTPWDGNHALGIRNFKDADGNIIPNCEFRGKLNAFPVRPKQEAQFSITIAPADLPRGAVTCEIDMVNEGAYWFNERGAASLTVPLSGFHNANSRNDAIAELVKASRSANDDERRKLAVLAQVLRSYDFLGYEGIARLGQMIRMRLSGKSYRQPVISSTTTSTMQRRNRERRQSAYFESFAAKFGNFRNGLPTDPVEYVDLFKRMVQDSNSFFRNSAPPLPPRLTQWLNSRALPAQLSSMPVSRSMIATLDDNMAIHFNRHQDFLNLMWRYITSVMIDHNLPVSLVPDPVVRAYATSPESCDDEEAFPQQTGFMARLLNDDAGYQSRYDATLAAGRCAYAFDLLLLGLENEARRLFVGQSILDWMTQPIGPSIAVSPFEILVMANLGGRSLGYITAHGQAVAPEIAALRASYDWLPAPELPDNYPLRVIGRARSSSGLGTNMRMTLAALDSVGIDVETINTDSDMVIPPRGNGRSFDRPIEIYHLNCDEIPALVSRYSTHARPDSYRIGFALWESSVMPEQHRGGATLMDELWVPTTYLQEVYHNAGFANVHVMGKGIDLGPVERLDRSTYGIHEDDFVFVTSFDIDSWVERKNPAAVVDAFARAFPNDPNVRLVVKTTGIFSHPGDRTGQIARVLAAADADPRILLVNERMPFPKYLGLIEMADALISAHRSEGFGYLPAYAMLLSRLVIVTNHSGTEDFCTEETSYPVASKLTPIAPGDFVYDAPGACWAEIDVEELAKTMQKVRHDPIDAERRAKAGYELVSQRYSMDALAQRYKERLDEIAG